MAIVVIPFVFSAGAVIIASQHNSNFSTIYSDYNGNIDNTNISSTAAIVYSKLSLTGGIINADINASAAIANSKLNLATVAQSVTFNGNTLVGAAHQGDILYDNGTKLTRLTPGTSGQFLKTQGASANPVWATPSLANVLFQFSANTLVTGAGIGEIVGTTQTPTTSTGNYRFLSSRDGGSSSYVAVWATKWIKVSGVSTVTVYAEIWQSAITSAQLKVDIGGANSTVTGTSSMTSPEWNSLTIDVSGLTNGTAYDVTVSLAHVSATTGNAFLGNLISFGS